MPVPMTKLALLLVLLYLMFLLGFRLLVVTDHGFK